jgi:adenylate cyclase
VLDSTDGHDVAAAPPTQSTILVVDDDPLNRRLLLRGLRHQGHLTLEADSGEAALEILAKASPDVVLLDVLMPGIDGFGVLEAMKSTPALADIPVVMISSLEDREGIARCIELGAEDFLPKPADPLILKARVTSGLAKRRLAQLERRRVRDVFSRFVPESMVDELLTQTGGELRIGARALTGTVMFNDLRGFTTFAESRSAEQVIDVLNHYLTQMSDAVLDHRGTLVAYLGDGMMSVFGAPVECDDHADRAVSAAREMLGQRLPAMNRWLSQQGLETEFRLGIGINTGPLMSGNVGSPRRLEYAAIGDTTNTTARVESLTKEYGVPVLMTEAVLDALSTRPPGARFVDEVAPRGKSAAVRLWTWDAVPP